MRRYRLSPAAERDIAEIWLYSARKWGMDRADKYIHALTEAMALSANDPLTGVSCDDVRPGYRKRASGSHVVFYKRVRTIVVIVRVLHQNMDFVRILH